MGVLGRLHIAATHQTPPEKMTADQLTAELNEILNGGDFKMEKIRMSHLAVALEDTDESSQLPEETHAALQTMLSRVNHLLENHPSNGSLTSLRTSLTAILRPRSKTTAARKPTAESTLIHSRVTTLLGGLFS